jgi:predicted secreted protein
MALDYIIGHRLRAYIGTAANATTPIAHAKSHKISFKKDTTKINHNDINPGSESGGFSVAIGGVKSATGSTTFYIYKAGSSIGAIASAWKDDTPMFLKFTDAATGASLTYTMPILITEFNITSEDDQIVEADVSYESTGEITFA